MGRDPSCSCPGRDWDKGPAGGPTRAVFMLVGIKRWSIARSFADQQSRARRRVRRAGPRPAPALCGTPARAASGSAGFGEAAPLSSPFGGRAPPEYQLNAGLQASPRPARSSGAPPRAPLWRKVTAPCPEPVASSRPTAHGLSSRVGGVQALGGPSLSPGPDRSANPLSPATSLAAPASPTAKGIDRFLA